MVIGGSGCGVGVGRAHPAVVGVESWGGPVPPWDAGSFAGDPRCCLTEMSDCKNVKASP